MDSDGMRFAAIAETTSFLHYFNDLPDHREAGKIDYPLPEIVLLILLAVLAGAEKRGEWLTRRTKPLALARELAAHDPPL
jgi:hypothetical protein